MLPDSTQYYDNSMILSVERIRLELQPYGISPSDALCDQIAAYIELLRRWNSKISLTTVNDPLEILRFHFGESVFGALPIDDKKSRLADVGSGAGFPGLAIKLYLPSLQVFLIEPNTKKATFLAEVGRILNLKSLEVLRFRMQDLPVEISDFHFITARALGRHDELLRWSQNRLVPHGEVALWLSYQDAVRLAKGSAYNWQELLKIPQSDHRVILRGTLNSP